MAYTSVTVILNPAAGSGTHQSGVRRAAEARQLDVRELHAGDRAGALAWEAVEQGAQVLVAAGGDGTVSAVAGDVRTVNGGVFLDNVSVGFYAAMVGDPQYRERRLRVAMRYAQRALLWGRRRASLRTSVPHRVATPEQVLAILVSNNAYSPGVAPRSALRPRLDEGRLWVYLLGLPGAGRPLPARLVRGTGRLISGRALIAAWPTTQQRMTTDTASIPVGIDGEAAELTTPLEFTIRPGALRLLQPAANEPEQRQFSLRW